MSTVEINDQIYHVHFGLSVIRRFALKHGMKTVEDFQDFVTNIDDSFEKLEKLSDLLLEGIKRGCEMKNEDCNLTLDDLFDVISDSPETYKELMEALMMSFQRNTPETSKPSKKKGKPAGMK